MILSMLVNRPKMEVLYNPLLNDSVTKGEFLHVSNNSEWTFRAGSGVSFEHPSESATVS